MNAVMQPTSNEVKREGLDDVLRSGRAKGQQGMILHTLYWHAQGEGATRQELAEALEIPLSSICGRYKELLDLELIAPIGTRGKPARQLLAITEKGMDQLAAQAAPAGEVSA